jgi:hypothetical protein
MTENPWKYNKQDSHKSYSQNSEQGNDQYLFIHESRDPPPIGYVRKDFNSSIPKM